MSIPQGLFDLSGRRAFVSGGATGIGFELARGFIAAGAQVAICGRNEARVKDAAEDIGALGLKCDVSSTRSVSDALSTHRDAFGGCEIVVNCAGTNIRANRPEEMSLEDWRYVLDTNLTGAFNVSTAAYEMLSINGGKIINISSVMGMFGAKALAAYSASKGGLELLTKSLAVAWADVGIQVNAIRPGWIATDMTRKSRSDPVRSGAIAARTPAGRYGQPEELVGTGVYLSSRASDFVTGAVINVDGGYMAQGAGGEIGV